jgi:drug/metabolite transporter (DMT)-like permease
MLWALLVLLTEATFTLLAVPVLARLGPWSLSLHASWLAAAGLLGLSLAVEGPDAVARLGAVELAAAGYLAVVVTALAFVLWYSAVARIGAARAGLLTGVAPVAAAVTGVALGDRMPGAGVWGGIAIVAAGLALGLSRHGERSTVGAGARCRCGRSGTATTTPAGHATRACCWRRLSRSAGSSAGRATPTSACGTPR